MANAERTEGLYSVSALLKMTGKVLQLVMDDSLNNTTTEAYPQDVAGQGLLAGLEKLTDWL